MLTINSYGKVKAAPILKPSARTRLYLHIEAVNDYRHSLVELHVNDTEHRFLRKVCRQANKLTSLTTIKLELLNVNMVHSNDVFVRILKEQSKEKYE